jgi:hypothetical protein
MALIMYGSIAAFLVAVAGTALLRSDRGHVRLTSERSLFLLGALGAPAPLFYVVVSRGSVLQLPEIDLLIFVFVSLIVFFRPRKAKIEPRP